MSREPLTLGIAGTAKNTGKTTTMIGLLNHFKAQGIKLGLTSIGYDGESVDNVTGLPKPRLYVPEGTYVVTASRCLENSSAKLSILETLPISTPLGKLMCGIVEKEGLIVTAGPNQTRHLRTVRDWLTGHGVELIFVDGALNRMAPMVETDGFILATGASYKPDTRQISADASYLAHACNLPSLLSLPSKGFIYPKQLALLNGPALSLAEAGENENRNREEKDRLKSLDMNGEPATLLWDKNGKILASASPSLFRPEELDPLAEAASLAAGLFCPGLITSSCLKRLPEILFPPEMTYVLENPVKLLAGNEPGIVEEFLRRIQEAGSRAVYRRRLPLLAITVNPFYPKYRYQTNDYEPAYIDRKQLRQRVAEAAEIPVFDVVEEGCEELAGVVFPGVAIRSGDTPPQ